jgi:hypothetical protein
MRAFSREDVAAMNHGILCGTGDGDLCGAASSAAYRTRAVAITLDVAVLRQWRIYAPATVGLFDGFARGRCSIASAYHAD